MILLLQVIFFKTILYFCLAFLEDYMLLSNKYIFWASYICPCNLCLVYFNNSEIFRQFSFIPMENVQDQRNLIFMENQAIFI